MSKPIHIVFLGCGRACALRSRLLRGMDGVELSFASREPPRAAAYSRRFGGRLAFGSYDEGLADPGIQAAFITTPTALHEELAMAALRAGKDVILETPAFMRSTDVQMVQSEAIARGRRVFVAENYFYKAMARRLRSWVTAGDFGDVRFVVVNATSHMPDDGWRRDPALSGGGALFETGVHWINFLSNIGLEVAEVIGYRSGASVGPDRSSLTVFRYTNGAVGTLTHSWELKAPPGGLRLSKVQGTLGAATFESSGLAYVRTGRRPGVGMPALRDRHGHRAMLRDFVEALRTGRPPQFTIAMAHRDLSLLERAQRTSMRHHG